MIPFLSFSQTRSMPDKYINILVDSINNNILFITPDSLITYSADNLDKISARNIDNPKLLELQPIFKNNKLIFLDKQGGDVFELSKTDSLLRIDKSNINKFLIGSSIFIKNDTLFRHGGYGFWSQSNFFTYLEERTEEWQIYPISKNSEIPISVNDHHAIIINDVFYFFGGTRLSQTGYRYNLPNSQAWSFDFKSKSWSYLGATNSDLLDVRSESFIIGDCVYLISELGKVQKIDIENNTIENYRVSPSIHTFKKSVDPIIFNNYLYFTSNNKNIDRVLIDEILPKVVNKTQFYSKKLTTETFLIFFVVILLLFSLFLVFNKIKLRETITLLDNGIKLKSKFIELDQTSLLIIKNVILGHVDLSYIYDLVKKDHLSKIQNERIKNQYLEEINFQMKVLTGIKSDFLVVKKSTFDARYKIVSFNIGDYKKFIK